MKLRHAHLAVVDRSKVRDYLLNSAHPDNGGKVRFFESLGFTAEHPEVLAQALRAVAHSGDVVARVTSAHGEKCVVDGLLSSHTERQAPAMVRTVWIIDHGLDVPRLVTAYPARSGPSA